MRTPAGTPGIPWSAITALLWLWPNGPAAAETRDEIKQAIQSRLPGYDPAVREKQLALEAARTAPRNAPAPLPGPSPVKAAAATPAPADASTLELPKVTVRPNTDAPKRLPRLTAPRPVDEVPGELWESDSGRDARLMKNHLGKLELFLARFSFFRASLTAAAREAEARQEKSRQLTELAGALEMQAALGRDPAEIRKLRGEYLKLYYSGPK